MPRSPSPLPVVLLALAAGLAVPASAGATCPAGTTAERGLGALERVVAQGPLPGRAGATVPVLVLPCERGRMVLEVRLRGSGTLIARGARDLRPGRSHRLLLRTTRAGARHAGRRLRLRLSAGFVARA